MSIRSVFYAECEAESKRRGVSMTQVLRERAKANAIPEECKGKPLTVDDVLNVHAVVKEHNL